VVVPVLERLRENLADLSEKYFQKSRAFVPGRDMKSDHLNDAGTNLEKFLVAKFFRKRSTCSIKDGILPLI